MSCAAFHCANRAKNGYESFHFQETQFGEKNGLAAAVEKIGNKSISVKLLRPLGRTSSCK